MSDLEHIAEILRRVVREELARSAPQSTWFTPSEAAAHAKVTTRTLRQQRVPMHKTGGVVRYLKSDVDAWLAGKSPP